MHSATYYVAVSMHSYVHPSEYNLGEARHSPQDFVTHHVAAISTAVQLADTLVIRNAAATLQFSLSMSG